MSVVVHTGSRQHGGTLKMILIFDTSNNLVMVSTVVPSSHEGADYTKKEYAEVYDPAYSYSLVDGVVVKGAVIPINTEELARLAAELEALRYQQNRKDVYPSIEDQLDDIYHNGVDAWKTTILAIKNAHPKPE